MNMNQKGFVNIILVLTIIAVAGVAGYFVLTRKQTPLVQQITIPTSATTQTPVIKNPTPATPTPPNETVSWKTYRNEKYGFSVMYPPSWNIFEMFDKQKYGREGVTLDSPARQKFEGVETPADINIVVETKSDQLSLEKFIEQYSDGWYSRYAVEEINTIGWRNARYVKSSDYRPANVIFIDRGHYVLIIPFNLDETYPDMPNLTMYKSIINTIKFN